MNRYRFPIAILILSVLTFGLFGTATPSPEAQAAPRTIPWDCSDWQESPAVADADDARVSMILESLAANRGKSIYCAIDQSNTWTKSETWLAGRDRNERDDTVYFGQQGNFRGFLAAQEGYLTDGESGVTGISRDRIFEFPDEPRRGKKTVRFRVRSESADTGTCPPAPASNLQQGAYQNGFVADDDTPGGTLICTNYGGESDSYTYDGEDTHRRTRNLYYGHDGGDTDWEVDWRTNIYRHRTSGVTRDAGGASRSPDWWRARAEEKVIPACRARGGKYVAGSADFGRGHNREGGPDGGVNDNGDYHGWFYALQRHSDRYPGGQNDRFVGKARESRTWVGVCTKRVRRR